MIDTSERDFEKTIEEALTGASEDASDWGVREPTTTYGTPESHYIKRHPEDYNRSLCLDSEMIFDFIYTTQASMWEELKTQHGAKVKERFLKRLVKEIETRGTLDVLRRGVKDLGCKFDMAYFKPVSGLNEEHRRLYNGNILSVTRQPHYSEREPNKSLDMVLFLNGIPIITAELKNPLKGQTVQDAVQQYRRDRDPKELFFKFGRCLAHFAVDTDLVYMTTHLKGGSTVFLPFNKGNAGGAGNPDNPDGFKTSYLWEEVWQKDSLLEIIAQYLQVVELEDDKGKKTGERSLIFPRYHQLDAVRRLVAHAMGHGSGQQYLIQHSAGSGKSNTIAWLCHQLSGLHDEEDRRVFDSIIVITDRRVLDRQLRRTIKQFEQVRGVVEAITTQKSRNLARALEEGKDIIITTLQTFPFAVDLIGKLHGKHFAVVIDEAHSSQSGEGATSVKKMLSITTLEEAEKEDVPAEDGEDMINARIEEEMRLRGRLPNVSFFAFTATPKNKTLELFGTQLPDGSFESFSLYTMRQAIEEGFILDVLQNYTTFKVYFSLLKKIKDDPRYDKKKATYLLRSYADLHEHAIDEKTDLMLEHFWTQVRHRIDDKAKTMVVTRSRLHAVRYKLAFDRYLMGQGYPFRALVAFSGTVKDPDSGQEFTESGMNGFPESQTAEAFKQNDCRILIVANKFQTGFDQPLLHTMYVDKKLGGVHAVQTLSRLNRTHPDKEETMVLDFANEAEEIQKSFQPYYEATLLTEPTDPNKLYDFERMLNDYHIFGRSDVDDFASVYFSKKGKQEKIHAVLNPVIDRYLERDEDERADFKDHLVSYVRLFAFLSQIITFTDADLEKLYQFSRHLLQKLPVPRDKLPVEITENINMDSYRIQQTSSGEIKLMGGDGELQPISELGTGRSSEEELAPLSEIVHYMNEHYGTEFTDVDKVKYFAEDMERRLTGNDALVKASNPDINSRENFRLAFNEFFSDTLEGMIDSNFEIYKKVVDDEEFGKLFRAVMFDKVYGRLSGEL